MEVGAFSRLPTELHQTIALNLAFDELKCYRLVCRATAIALQDQSFWHLAFLEKFGPPQISGAQSVDWFTHYKSRLSMLAATDTDFHASPSSGKHAILKCLKELILDANPVIAAKRSLASKNFAAIAEFVRDSDLVRDMFKPQPVSSRKMVRPYTEDLRVVLLCLSAHVLDGTADQWYPEPPIYGFPESQVAAYLSVVDAPIFSGVNYSIVNIDWCLHVVHFFRYHMLTRDASTLCREFGSLPVPQRPQMWNQRLYGGAPDLGKVWRGTYSFIERKECDLIRDTHGREFSYSDQNLDNEEPIQTMKMFRPSKSRQEKFNPLLFERILKSVTPYRNAEPQSKTNRTKKAILDASYPFECLGYDEENFYAVGYINPLPVQRGIPGWSRITMMKYFKDDNDFIDTGALWAYEGVLLPGAQIMVGRWWSPERIPESQQYSGPFILWNVDGAWEPAEAEFVADHRGLAPERA